MATEARVGLAASAGGARGARRELTAGLVQFVAVPVKVGGLTVEAAEDEAAGEIVIRITDTGKGIPPAVMPFLFEPFFTTKKVGRGTGLGLAIVHGVVTRAGGRVEATSAPGATTFAIRLPKAERGDSNGPTETAGAGAGQSTGR
ncbi:MAG: HAMP domain-containing sensor histidine kinase [Acidobacteria bacterium]|nr:HAMP domain-containing sensor histidine kinase [Acidobacteriota bacterium]